MRTVHLSIRQIGNSQGVVIPKTDTGATGSTRNGGSGMTIEGGALVLRRSASPARTGWAEAASSIAEAGGNELAMGEFGNAEDSELIWWRVARFGWCILIPPSGGKPGGLELAPRRERV